MADEKWFYPGFGASSDPMFGLGFGASSNPMFRPSRRSFSSGSTYDPHAAFLALPFPRNDFTSFRGNYVSRITSDPFAFLGMLKPETSPEFVSRDDWGARKAKGFIKLNHPVKTVYIHHTAGAESDSLEKSKKIAKQIQDYHMNERKYADAGYSFLIDNRGNVLELRGWDRVGAHTANHNSKSIGIAFMGNYENGLPSNAALKAAKKLVEEGIKLGKLPKDVEIKGHRDTKDTVCPGARLYEWSKTLNKKEEK